MFCSRYIVLFLFVALIAFGSMTGRVLSQEETDTPKLAEQPGKIVGEAEKAKESSEPTEAATVFDPIEKNGRYFEGWPKPKVAFVFTGFQDGYLEPCGCAGMNEMKGGLSRRMSFLTSLREMNWPLIAIDGGDIGTEKTGQQAELKFQLTVDAFRIMKYDAVGLGVNDLRFSVDDILSVTVNIPDEKSMFTGLNIAPCVFDPSYLTPYQIVERGGVRVGVVSIITDGLLTQINNPDIVKAKAVDKIKEILPELESKNCQFLVLISHGKRGQVLEETQALLKSFPNKFGIVLVSDPPAEPPRQTPKVIDGRYYIEVGEKGKFAVVLGVFDDKETPVRYQSVALDSRYVNSPVIMEMMQIYQDRLKQNVAQIAKTYSDPKAEIMGKYIGSKECQSCHENSYNVWKKSGHAHAWKSLVETSKPGRAYDPECVACHVVGWNSTSQYGYIGGFDITQQEKTKHLFDVGCENCHGPGEKHKAAEMGSDKALQENLRKAVRLPLENASKNCISCHDGDNSPKFNFKTYWPKIQHKESEEN